MKKQTKYPKRKESWFTTCGVGVLLLAIFLCVVGLIAQNLFSFEKNYRFFVFLILIIVILVILGTVISVIGVLIDFYKDKHDK